MRIGIIGCAIDTGNLGVTALCYSLIRGLLKQDPELELTVFGFENGVKDISLDVGGLLVPVRLVGMYKSRSIYKSSSIANIRVAKSLRLSRLHSVLAEMEKIDSFVDVSGGDSFTDLYGQWRLESILEPKELVLNSGRPLVLAPQTYGPFSDSANYSRIRKVVESSSGLWARDDESATVLSSVYTRASKSRLISQGIDVAFGLPAVKPPQRPILSQLESFFDRFETTVGVNVSGLLVNRPGVDVAQFGFKTSYSDVLSALISNLSSSRDIGLLLVPHVLTGDTHYEDDVTALKSILRKLPVELKNRTFVWEGSQNPCHAKWVIGSTTWFCGTRMHACIAAISSGVPTLAIAYSDKTRGVFRTVGLEDSVLDPRICSSHEVAQKINRFANDYRGFDLRDEPAFVQIESRWERQFYSMGMELGVNTTK